MNFRKFAAFFIAVLMALTILTGCQSQAAQYVDEQILMLVNDDVSLSAGDTLQSIQTQMDALSEREYNSLKNIETFEAYYTEYKVLEDKAVEEIEAAINKLPAPDAISLASEETIQDAAKMYDRTTDIVKNRISNAAALEAAKTGLEKYKEACWVECNTCGGDGVVACSLCRGSGSRMVNHTTPNGKTWRVSQDCKTTSSCRSCSGNGGIYVED